MSNKALPTSNHRETWADIAKAISIILVVMHHTIYFSPIKFEGYQEVFQFNNALLLLRMPLFFFISGFFAKSVIDGNWNNFIHKRAVPLLYLYSLWSVIKWALIIAVPVFLMGEVKDVYSIFYIFFEPLPTLWFIYALFLYIAFTWLMRRFSKWMVLGFALLVFFAYAQDAQTLLEFDRKLARFFICFYCGYMLRPYLKDISLKVPTWTLLILPLYFYGLYEFIGSQKLLMPIFMLVLMASNIAFGLVLSVQLSRTKLNSGLSYIGQHTLPIYVFHFIPLTILNKFDLYAYLHPILVLWILVFVSIMLSIIAQIVAEKIKLGWLFHPPHLKGKKLFFKAPRISE